MTSYTSIKVQTTLCDSKKIYIYKKQNISPVD